MANFFDQVKDNAKGVEEKLIGPDYKYYEKINSPSEMGMSSDGSISAITKDISGLIGYVTLLSAGGGRASKTSGPLGNKFFLETGAKCQDKATGQNVTRSIYINNVPDGSIPFISSGLGGTNFSSFKGLIPGTLSNLSQINPMQIFGAFMSGVNPECQAITMETVDVNNIKSDQTAYVTTNDIGAMNACWFKDKKNPATNSSCRETFTTMGDSQEYRDYVREYKKKHHINMPLDYNVIPNDMYVKLYYSSLMCIMLYIIYKLSLRH